jgi:hypothetical protein
LFKICKNTSGIRRSKWLIHYNHVANTPTIFQLFWFRCNLEVLALIKYYPWSDSPWEVAPIRATGMFKYATSNNNISVSTAQ